MIADIEDNKVNCVVVKDLSRFGRDYIDTGRYLERIFPELNVRFISVTGLIHSIVELTKEVERTIALRILSHFKY